MRAFLATVLSVIAVGVLLIAYGLLSPGMATAGSYQLQARPVLASDRVGMVDEGLAPAAQYFNYPAPAPAYTTARPAAAYPVSQVRPVPAVYETVPAPAPERVVYRERAATRTVASAEPRRDWKKSAMVIGGTTAAGAGVGAIFGGKKGALIGAAIGAGGGTVYEMRKK